LVKQKNSYRPLPPRRKPQPPPQIKEEGMAAPPLVKTKTVVKEEEYQPEKKITLTPAVLLPAEEDLNISTARLVELMRQQSTYEQVLAIKLKNPK
jgi:hypothetical protein